MIGRRYVHVPAGRLASVVFAAAGILGGLVAHRIISGGPPIAINAVLWCGAGGVCAYLVFASEGPHQRPVSFRQAAVADGIVAGVIVTLLCVMVDVLVSEGAGASSGSGLAFGVLAESAAGAIVLGALVGAALGGAILLVGGRGRLERAGGASRASARRARTRSPGARLEARHKKRTGRR